MVLRLEQVSYTLSSRTRSSTPLTILQHISLTVNPGDFVGLVGAAGSGKTTLLHLLNRLREPTAGKIFLDGIDYRQIPVVQLRQRVPLVLQETKLLGMTVQQALTYPLELRGLTQTEIFNRLEIWRSRLPIPDEWLSRTELQLSLGQRQWVAIVRALMIQPTLLLFDEPTAHLDRSLALQFLQVLGELTTQKGTIVVMASHQLEFVQAFASRISYLQAGQLLQDLPNRHTDWPALIRQIQHQEQQLRQEWADEDP